MYVRLMWLAMIVAAIVLRYELFATALLIVFTVGNMWVLTTFDKGASNTSVMKAASTEFIGNEGSKITSIAGPVEKYQDNTYEETNLDVCMTKIPDGIDIQGTLTDLPGFELL